MNKIVNIQKPKLYHLANWHVCECHKLELEYDRGYKGPELLLSYDLSFQSDCPQYMQWHMDLTQDTKGHYSCKLLLSHDMSSNCYNTFEMVTVASARAEGDSVG